MAVNKENNESKKITGGNIAVFMFLLIIVGIVTGCLFSPVFNITEVNSIDGVNVTSSEIINAANITLGENIFKLNDSKIEERIEKLPYVRTASIHRNFPSTIELKIEERKPYAIIKYLESFVITDKYGYVLEIKKENDMKDLPIIYGLDFNGFSVGKKIEGTALLKYENCTYLFETADKMNLKYEFAEINYADSTNVKLCIKEIDIDVIYGNVDIVCMEEKLSHLSSILDKLENKKGKLDMSDENYLAKTVFTEKK